MTYLLDQVIKLVAICASCAGVLCPYSCHHFAPLFPSFASCVTILRRHLAPPSCAAISFTYHLRRHLTPSHCAPIKRLHSSTVFLYCYIMSPYCVTTETLQTLLQSGKFLRKTFFARSYNAADKHLTCCLIVCFLYFTTVNQTIFSVFLRCKFSF